MKWSKRVFRVLLNLPVKRLYRKHQFLFQFWTYLCILFAAYMIFVMYVQILGTNLKVPYLYRKDFVPEYLMAKSILDNKNPYVPIQIMAASYLNIPSYYVLHYHPSPHPLTVGLMLLPFAHLPYTTAYKIWIIILSVSFAASLFLLYRSMGLQHNIKGISITVLLLLSSYPVLEEFNLGQITLIQLLCLSGALYFFRSGKKLQAGLLLGFGVLLKQFLWPVILPFIILKQWKTTAASLGTVLGGYVVFMMILGIGVMREYLTRTVFDNIKLYQTFSHNISSSGIAWRLFAGMETNVLGVQYNDLSLPPYIYNEGLAAILSKLIPVILLLFVWIKTYKLRKVININIIFAVFICLSILISPIAWSSYLTLLIIPIFTVFKEFKESKVSFKKRSVFFIILFLLYVCVAGYTTKLYVPFHFLNIPLIPYLSFLITLAPTLLLFTLLLYLLSFKRALSILE